MKNKKTLVSKKKQAEERRERIIVSLTWIFAGVCGFLFILVCMAFAFNIVMG